MSVLIKKILVGSRKMRMEITPGKEYWGKVVVGMEKDRGKGEEIGS